jgi:hypothetical protein
MTRSTRIDILCALARKGGRLPSAPSLSPTVEPARAVSSASPLRSTIAGALRDWRGLSIVGLTLALVIFAYGAMA